MSTLIFIVLIAMLVVHGQIEERKAKLAMREATFGPSNLVQPQVTAATQCKVCDHPVAPRAQSCPKCGQPTPNKNPIRKVELLECRVCGNRVSENAERCPKCDARPQFDAGKLAATAVLALALMGAVVAIANIWVPIEQFRKTTLSVAMFATIAVARLIVNQVVKLLSARKW